MTEYEARMEALAAKLGVAVLQRLIPVPVERVAAALAAGDEHLNTIPLGVWDRAAGVLPVWSIEACPLCGTKRPRTSGPNDWPYEDLRRTAREEPWSREPGLSLSDRTGVLKHVAKTLAVAR